MFAPIELPPELAAAARGGQNVDPNDPIFATFGENYLKIRLRSHRDVALAHYADLGTADLGDRSIFCEAQKINPSPARAFVPVR